jgi:hypothetical protein
MARACDSEGQPGDSGRDGRHDEVAGEFFMNKFRKLGFIDYNGRLEVHSSLLNMVLHETPGITKGSDGS